MKRITPAVKAIADRHIAAAAARNFDDPPVTTAEEVKAAMVAGKTFSEAMRIIEARHVPVMSSVLSGVFGHTSINYRKGVYNGFKQLFT